MLPYQLQELVKFNIEAKSVQGLLFFYGLSHNLACRSTCHLTSLDSLRPSIRLISIPLCFTFVSSILHLPLCSERATYYLWHSGSRCDSEIATLEMVIFLAALGEGASTERRRGPQGGPGRGARRGRSRFGGGRDHAL